MISLKFNKGLLKFIIFNYKNCKKGIKEKKLLIKIFFFLNNKKGY